MISRKSLVATGTLTALIIAMLLSATLVTPVLATTSPPTASKIPTLDEIRQIIEQIKQEIPKGRIVTGYLTMKFADVINNIPVNLTNWTITPKGLGMAFNIRVAQIVEFIDTNGDGVLSDGDTKLRLIELTKMSWTLLNYSVTDDEVNITLKARSEAVSVTIYIRVYFMDSNVTSPENATGPKYWTVVPGWRAVKIDIVINKYEWVDKSNTSKLALVMVLKCERTEREYEYRYRLANGITFSDEDRKSGSVPRVPGDEDESEIGLVMARNEHEVRARFRWFNYALCSEDTQQKVVDVTSYFNVTKEGIELQLCVDHFGESEVSFDPYFVVLSVEEKLPAEAALLFLQFQYAAQSGRVFGIALTGVAVLLVAGVAAALYLRRRH